MIIITYKEPLEIGKVYTQEDLKSEFRYGQEYHKTYTFMVLREATIEEYEQLVRATFGEHLTPAINKYFYQISMD